MFNNTVTEQWEYVRYGKTVPSLITTMLKSTLFSNITTGFAADSPTVHDQYMPYYDIYNSNIRCGRGAATSGLGTKTATVMAGSEVGFVIGRSADEVSSRSSFIRLNEPLSNSRVYSAS